MGYPAGSAEEVTSVVLRLARPGVYRAEMTVSSPGTWVQCTWEPRCGGGPSMKGYPNRIELEVASSAPEPDDPLLAYPAEPSPSRLPMPLLALAALVISAAAVAGPPRLSKHLRR